VECASNVRRALITEAEEECASSSVRVGRGGGGARDGGRGAAAAAECRLQSHQPPRRSQLPSSDNLWRAAHPNALARQGGCRARDTATNRGTKVIRRRRQLLRFHNNHCRPTSHLSHRPTVPAQNTTT